MSEETRSGEHHDVKYYSRVYRSTKAFSSGHDVNCAKSEPDFKGTKTYAMCLKFRKQWLYSFLQSSHLREKVTFSSCCHPGTSKYSNAWQNVWSRLYRSELRLWCYVYASSSEGSLSVERWFKQGSDDIITRYLGNSCRRKPIAFHWIVYPDETLFCCDVSFTSFPA